MACEGLRAAIPCGKVPVQRGGVREKQRAGEAGEAESSGWEGGRQEKQEVGEAGAPTVWKGSGWERQRARATWFCTDRGAPAGCSGAGGASGESGYSPKSSSKSLKS